MSGPRRDDGERARRLMMAALDGELSAEERGELDRLLEGDEELRDEWRRLRRVKEVTSTMALREPPEEIWDSYWASGYNRLERGLGWILVSLAAIAVTTFGAWRMVEEILEDLALPGFVKLALFALVLGLAVLLVSVIREKVFTNRRDPYREVKR